MTFYELFSLFLISSLIIIIVIRKDKNMAGKKKILFRLLSSAGTGYFYVGSKPTMYIIQ